MNKGIEVTRSNIHIALAGTIIKKKVDKAISHRGKKTTVQVSDQQPTVSAVVNGQVPELLK